MKEYQVGGIIYALSKTQPKKENNLPDISSMKSMVHEPVVITEEVKTEGYQPRFNFRNTSQNQENSRQTSIETPIVQHKPEIKNLIFDLVGNKNPIVTSTTLTETSSSNKDI